MDLLGDVGEVEVRRERPAQSDGRTQVDALQASGGRRGVDADEAAYVLHELEQLGALLTDQGLTEVVAETPDVRTQTVVRVGVQLAARIHGN